jgi:hypothetical protein
VNAALFMAAGITVLAVFLFVAESQSLSEGHARVRTQLYNAARWGFVIALSWVLIPAAFAQPGAERAATILGLTVLIGALILIPLRWFIRMGGRRGSWELRRAKLEVGRLSNRVKHDPASIPPSRLREAADRVSSLRKPSTADLCDLLVAQLDDLIEGKEDWNEGGRRSIRIDQLARELWSEEMPPPDNDPAEATFRWFLYKTFGRMMEIGASVPTKDSRAEFSRLLQTLEDYRRPDTKVFIEAVRTSGEAWVADSASGRPWIDSYEFEALGPVGLDEIRWIWGREAAMWGAFLDEDDLRAIQADLTRRKASTAAASGKAAGPHAAHATLEAATPRAADTTAAAAMPEPSGSTEADVSETSESSEDSGSSAAAAHEVA